jgi:hypothetical protein
VFYETNAKFVGIEGTAAAWKFEFSESVLEPTSFLALILKE